MADPSDWPGNGEIDVVETVNQGNTGNQMALHTSKNCQMKSRRAQTGTVHGTNCYNGTNDNAGCAVMGASSSYGAEANDDGGAVSVFRTILDTIPLCLHVPGLCNGAP